MCRSESSHGNCLPVSFLLVNLLRMPVQDYWQNLHAKKSFVAGKAQAIAGCSKAQMNLCPFVPESFVAQQMMESKRPLLIGLESFEHSASSNRAKDKCKCAPLF